MRGLIVAIAIVGWADGAHAGAWPQTIGETLLISTTDYTSTNTGFDDEGEATVDLLFQKTESRLYAEYGLSEQITLVGQSSFQDVLISGIDGKSRYIGPGSFRGGARMRLWEKGGHVVAGFADLGYQRGGEFVTDGELIYEDFSSELRLLYGYGWDRTYVDVQAGYLHRYSSAPGTWLIDIAGGWDVAERWQVIGSVSGRATDEARLDADIISKTRSLKLKSALLWKRSESTHWELGWVETVAGRNHVRDGGVTLALWKRF